MATTRLRLIPAALLLSSFASLSAAQQPAAAANGDPIVGAWKLNASKSANPNVEDELIVISADGPQYKIVIAVDHGNSPSMPSQFLTDMKGTKSNLEGVDGKQVNADYVVSRVNPGSFTILSVGQYGGEKKEYTVSPDGKSMTVRTTPDSKPAIVVGKMNANGQLESGPSPVLFLDRIPDADGQTQLKGYVKAASAAAARYEAASRPNTAACEHASDATGEWKRYNCNADGFSVLSTKSPGAIQLKDSTRYDLSPSEEVTVFIHANNHPTDCNVWWADLQKNMNRKPQFPPGFPAPKSQDQLVSLGGPVKFHGLPAWETTDPATNRPMWILYDLFVCEDGKTYQLHARWPSANSKPESVNRIFDSLQTLPKPQN